MPDGIMMSGGWVPVDSSFGRAYPGWNYWKEIGQAVPAGSAQKEQFAVSLDFSGLNINIPSDLDGIGFSILCSGCKQYIDISFDANKSTTFYTSSPAPPPGQAKNNQARAYTIGVQNVTNAADLAKAVFDGISSVQGQVYGNINASNRVDTTASNVSIDAGHHLRMAEINGKYYFLKEFSGPSLQFINGLFGRPKNDFAIYPKLPGTPLVIHTGSKANQRMEVFINGMYPKNLGIENTHVTPMEAALMAIGTLDNALEYSLNEITRMGAYRMRLGQTEENLVTNEENTQAAESIIRDADMAKEMTDYAKANILTQSAQAVLAQANQNSSNVLNLLK